MSTPLPRAPRHLHVFGISLMLIVGALIFFLFGVKMETSSPATGLVQDPKGTDASQTALASLHPEPPAIRLEFEEKHFGPVEPGQQVRLYSNMYHHRTHGIAKGVIDWLEPAGGEGPNGSRRFHAWVKITDSPFPMKLGSSLRAEVITGRKPTYQIILEH